MRGPSPAVAAIPLLAAESNKDDSDEEGDGEGAEERADRPNAFNNSTLFVNHWFPFSNSQINVLHDFIFGTKYEPCCAFFNAVREMYQFY